jgi:outer membrane protein TolC
MPHRPHRSWYPCVAAALAACSAASFAADADDEVAAVLGDSTQATLANREQTVLRPETLPLTAPADPSAAPAPGDPAAPADPSAPAAPPALPGTPPEVYDLPRALATAVRQNRDFLSRRESLYQAGLSLSLTRFDFGPQLNAAIRYLWPRSEDGAESHRLGWEAGASQILPTGGRVAVAAGFDAAWPFGPGVDTDQLSANTAISLTQPLLRGAGHAIAWEPLIQAERQLVYSVRDFELFREDFTIRIARQYFDLTSQKKTLANEDANYDAAVFDRKKAEALLQVGRNSEKEVFLARRREITAKDQLINARAAYDRAVDGFKIELGLPTTVPIELADAEPPYEPVRYDAASAIAAARANRLDLISQRQQVEDSERALQIAANGLLPDLALSANFGTFGVGDDLGESAPDEWTSSVGLTLEIPLQRKPQRNAYRSAQISLEQARRGLQLAEDRLDLDIRDALRQLQSIEERIVLQEDQITQERRAVTVMEIRYESGDVDNRELLEARQALTDARNALIRLRVDHFIARLNLLKDMGVFFVDDQGMWR